MAARKISRYLFWLSLLPLVNRALVRFEWKKTGRFIDLFPCNSFFFLFFFFLFPFARAFFRSHASEITKFVRRPSRCEKQVGMKRSRVIVKPRFFFNIIRKLHHPPHPHPLLSIHCFISFERRDETIAARQNVARARVCVCVCVSDAVADFVVARPFVRWKWVTFDDVTNCIINPRTATSSSCYVHYRSTSVRLATYWFHDQFKLSGERSTREFIINSVSLNCG